MKSETVAGSDVLSVDSLPSTDAPDEGAHVEPRQSDLGWMPALSVSTALGLLTVASGFTLSRNGVSWAESLFWLGLIIMYAPVVARLVTAGASRVERIALVGVLGMGLYLVKLFHSPLTFTEHDEFYHWRTTLDILQSGHLFHVNPLLPVSALFPGMETVTAALAGVAHLSIFQAGVLVVGVARLVMMLCVFLFVEDASGSSRVAGIAAAIYMANPNFLFFDAMFKYETMALTFAALALFVLARHQSVLGGRGYRLMALAVIMVGATVISHHITAYLLALFLIAWTAAAFWRRRTEPRWKAVGTVALVAVVLNVVWLVVVAQKTIGYLSPVLGGAIRSVLNLVLLRESGRTLFASSTGYVAPVWERALGLASVAIIMIGLGFGLWLTWRGRGRVRAVGFVLALGAVAYPVSLASRFAGSAWETANRSSEFVFLAVGFVLALAIAGLGQRAWPGRRIEVPASICLTIAFLGGMIAGWSPQWRMPGPYLPMAADTRGIDSQTLGAAAWTAAHLGRHARIGADDLNELTLGSFGDQNPISGMYGGQDINFTLVFPQFLVLKDKGARLHYLLVDNRLTQVPYGSVYNLAYYQVTHTYGGDNVFPRADAPLQVATSLEAFDAVWRPEQ